MKETCISEIPSMRKPRFQICAASAPRLLFQHIFTPNPHFSPTVHATRLLSDCLFDDFLRKSYIFVIIFIAFCLAPHRFCNSLHAKSLISCVLPVVVRMFPHCFCTRNHHFCNTFNAKCLLSYS